MPETSDIQLALHRDVPVKDREGWQRQLVGYANRISVINKSQSSEIDRYIPRLKKNGLFISFFGQQALSKHMPSVGNGGKGNISGGSHTTVELYRHGQSY